MSLVNNSIMQDFWKYGFILESGVTILHNCNLGVGKAPTQVLDIVQESRVMGRSNHFVYERFNTKGTDHSTHAVKNFSRNQVLLQFQ